MYYLSSSGSLKLVNNFWCDGFLLGLVLTILIREAVNTLVAMVLLHACKLAMYSLYSPIDTLRKQ